MPNPTATLEPVATILSTILGIKALRSALKLLRSVAPASILESKQARTFFACFNNETWVGARSGNVKMLTRCDRSYSPSDGLHCFPIERLERVAKSIDPENEVKATWDDGMILTLESRQRNGLRSTFNLQTYLADGIELPEACGVDCWSTPARDFSEAIESAKVAMGEVSGHDCDGIFLDCSGETIEVKATDGSQLFRRTLDSRDSGPIGKAFVRSEQVKSLLSVLKATDDYLVRFRIEAVPTERMLGGKTEIVNRVKFSLRTDNVILEIMTEPARFPLDGRSLGGELLASVELTEPAILLKAIEAAWKTSEPDVNGARPVTLVSDSGSLRVETESLKTPVGVSRIIGKPFSRTFDGKLLIPYLKTIAKLDNLAISVSFPEPGARDEPIRFHTLERGEHWIMPYTGDKPETAKVKPPGARSPEPVKADPEPVVVASPEPVAAPEPAPLPEIPAWAMHVRVTSCDRVTDYKRDGEYSNIWSPSGNQYAPYMAIERTDYLRQYLAIGKLAIVTPEPVPTTSPETIPTAWKDVSPGARIYNPHLRHTLTVRSISKSWCGGIRIDTEERGEIIARHDTILDVIPEPAKRAPVKVAACNPEPDPTEVKPLRPIAPTPVPSFPDPASCQVDPLPEFSRPEVKPGKVNPATLSMTLPDGTVVGAKRFKGEIIASTYANRTQAEKRRDAMIREGLDAEVIQRGRPFFVRIGESPPSPCQDTPEIDAPVSPVAAPDATESTPEPLVDAPLASVETPAPTLPDPPAEIVVECHPEYQADTPGPDFSADEVCSWGPDPVPGFSRPDPIDSALMGRSRLARVEPPTEVFDRDGRIHRAEMMAAERVIRAEIVKLVAIIRMFGEGPAATLTRSERAWHAMDSGERQDFVAWLDHIGYRPGEADYGRLAPDEAWDHFIAECIWGSPVFFLSHPPDGPLSTDPTGHVDNDAEAPRSPQEGLRRAEAESTRPALEVSTLVILVHGIGLPVIRFDTATLPQSTYAPRPGVSRPAPIVAHLSIEIGGRAYGLAVNPDGYTLEKPDGELHEVTVADDGRAMCSCRDWKFRHSGLNTQGCRHIRALRAVRLLPPVRSFPDPEPIPEPCHDRAARFFGMS